MRGRSLQSINPSPRVVVALGASPVTSQQVAPSRDPWQRVIKLTGTTVLFLSVVVGFALRFLAFPCAALGQECINDAGCGEFEACVNKKCCTPSDFNNKCGGNCGVKCADSGRCHGNDDCQSATCSGERCCGPGCNGNCMNHCKNGQGCSTGDDCENFACVNQKCCTPSDFGKQCGGDCGVKCPGSSVCASNNDCQSGLCSQGTCNPSGQAPAQTPG